MTWFLLSALSLQVRVASKPPLVMYAPLRHSAFWYPFRFGPLMGEPELQVTQTVTKYPGHCTWYRSAPPLPALSNHSVHAAAED
ncbi:hypothetical protein [Streptomyces sp. NBC_00019]|uniref:hypothetical protein n=1 Tax=Streptomyces sp. NBC_00019 TaxID=2975623 RepID=UPI0032552B84